MIVTPVTVTMESESLEASSESESKDGEDNGGGTTVDDDHAIPSVDVYFSAMSQLWTTLFLSHTCNYFELVNKYLVMDVQMGKNQKKLRTYRGGMGSPLKENIQQQSRVANGMGALYHRTSLLDFRTGRAQSTTKSTTRMATITPLTGI